MRNRSKVLSVVVPQLYHLFEDAYFGCALSGAYDRARELSYRIMLEVASPEFREQKTYLRLFQEEKIDGMIYIGSTNEDTYLQDFLQTDYPFVFAGSYLNNFPLNYTIGDNLHGGYLATKHLIGLGHKKIGMVTGHFRVVSAGDRHQGYKKALAEAGLKYDESLVFFADFKEHTALAVKNLLNSNVDAIFCGNDRMAMGVIDELKKSGRRVPDELAIVGMDNIRLGEMTAPKLTTVTYDVYLIAQKAMQKLVELIEAYYKERWGTLKPVAELVTVELVIRESCGYHVTAK